jgi:hypothetical protein
MKLKILVDEKVTYEHKVTIEVADEIDIDKMLDKAEKQMTLDDVVYMFESKYNCKIIEICRDDGGTRFDIEVPEYEEI